MKPFSGLMTGLALGVLAVPAMGQILVIGNGQQRVEGTLPTISLLEYDDVREDLQITRTQAEAIDAIMAAGKKRDDELFKGIDRFNTDHADQPPHSTSYSEWGERGRFLDGLLNPAQQKRLRSLKLQSLGFLALFNPGLQRDLGLSAEQIAALDQADGARNERRNRDFGALGPGITIQKAHTVTANLRAQGEAETLAILTPAQQKAYRTILGKPVKSASDFGLDRV